MGSIGSKIADGFETAIEGVEKASVYIGEGAVEMFDPKEAQSWVKDTQDYDKSKLHKPILVGKQQASKTIFDTSEGQQFGDISRIHF